MPPSTAVPLQRALIHITLPAPSITDNFSIGVGGAGGCLDSCINQEEEEEEEEEKEEGEVHEVVFTR